jgi:ATP-dependent Zn protease
MTDAGLRGVAYHEAGHAVVALALGLRVERVQIFGVDLGKTDLAPTDHLPLWIGSQLPSPGSTQTTCSKLP